MSVILVVETDASYAQRISEAMQSAGLPVEVCESADSALRRAAIQRPGLIVASSAVPDVRSLLGRFARAQGGPGSVALIPSTLVGRISAGDYHADALLPKPFTAEEARQVLLPLLPSGDEPRPQQWSSAEIFGDVVAEVEGRSSGPRPAPRQPSPAKPRPLSSSAEIDRKLEETLSGVLPVVTEPRRAAKPRAKRTSTDDIDELLDKTLSSLELPRKKKRPPAAPAAPPAPASAEAAAGLETPLPPAPAPAPAPPAAAAPLPVAAPPPASAPPPAETTGGESVLFEPPPPLEAPPLPAVPPVSEAPPAVPESVAGIPDPDAPAEAPIPSPAGVQDSVDPWPAAEPPPIDDFDYRTKRLTIVPPRESVEGEIFGDYTLLRRIAVGGMAEVWQARRRGVEGFQKTVAIKKILSHLTGSPDFVSMFIDEAKLAAQLNHNNIIQIYDLGKVGDDFFIAMEHVDGMDVRSILGQAENKGRPLPMRLALTIASSVARALDYAHRKRDFDNQALGLVHRDVSPQNILISFEGEIKLCDFGIVKAVAKASTTQMGALKGKLQYMSPEQAWGKTVDARSDVFSLGSVLFEMLTGRRLFAGDSEIGVLDAVRECQVRGPRELAPEIPEDVDRLVRRALAKDPEERYQTAGEMEEDLKRVISSLKPVPGPSELSAYLQGLAAAPEPDAGEVPALGDSGRPAAAAFPAAAPAQEPIAETAEPFPAIPEEIADPPIAQAATPAARPAAPKRRAGGALVKLLIAAVVVAAVSAVVFFVLRATDGGWTSPAEAGRPADLPPQEPRESRGSQAAPGSDAAAAEEGAAPAPEEDVPAAAEPDAGDLDLEGLVDEELARQREEIEKKLEEELGAQKRQLERELEAARKAAEAAEKGGGGA